MASWVIASSVPPRLAPSASRSIEAGRWPSPYICWRVRTRRTERSSAFAPSTASTASYCGRSPDPNAPPVKGDMTRMSSGFISNTPHR